MSKETQILLGQNAVLSTHFSSELIKDILLSQWLKQNDQLPPRSILLVLNIEQINQIIALGAELLGLGKGKVLSINELMELCPKDHHRLLEIYINAMKKHWSEEIQQCMWNHQGLFLLGIQTSLRISNDEENGYALTYFSVEPFQPNDMEPGKLIFLWGHVLGTYKNEPLQVNLIGQNGFIISQEWVMIDDWLKAVKKEVFERLRFTKYQQSILKSLIEQQANAQLIAIALDISVRTVEGHCRNILARGRKLFEQANFRTAHEVALYLSRQNFLE